MWRVLSYILAGVLTSFYFFPFEFTFLPGVNTKMVMAGFGLLLLGTELARGSNALFDKGIFQLSILALIVSFWGVFSVIYNGTYDYTYATYIVSMLVWLSAAYVVIKLIKYIHGQVSVTLIINYLISVCVFQCIIALAIDMIPALKNFVNSIVLGTGFLMNTKDLSANGRLYGIGAVLDVAGSRFAAVLVMIAYIVANSFQKKSYDKIYLYLIAFLIILLLGNMIARTTTVGVVISLFYWIFVSVYGNQSIKSNIKKIWKLLGVIVIVSVPIIVYFYNTNENIHQNIRFGFEGFFSLFETGHWQTGSNDTLKNMYVFPETLKTWLVGDGYFENPCGDPYYMGYRWKGFYMGTDVGYLRFIFYFGILGLLSFCLFMVRSAFLCINKSPKYKVLFILILMLNFIVWLKVSTDIFLVLALFLCLSEEKSKEDVYKVYG